MASAVITTNRHHTHKHTIKGLTHRLVVPLGVIVQSVCEASNALCGPINYKGETHTGMSLKRKITFVHKRANRAKMLLTCAIYKTMEIN